jgi:hypothetical protein
MKRKMGPMILRIGDFLLWRDFFRFMFKKYQTKFFLYAGIKAKRKLTIFE